MTEYRVMVKAKRNKRFQSYGHYTEAYYADRNAERLANELWTKEVKIIVTDSNGIKNELVYKKAAE